MEGEFVSFVLCFPVELHCLFKDLENPFDVSMFSDGLRYPGVP